MAYLPELRLIYLPFRAMAEPTRFMLHFANIPYTDELIWGPAFQREKALDGFPFDKTPILEIDGQRLAQSGSISRYVAKLAGLYPRDPLECAFADHIFEMGQEMCTINPLINCFTGYHHQSVKFEYFRGLPRIFQNLERQLGDKKYFGGVEPNFADFQMLHYLLNIFLSEDDCFSRNPTLRRYTLEMSELPGVREYLESRPELIDIGVDPKLKDKNGTVIAQRSPEGRAWMQDGILTFGEPPKHLKDQRQGWQDTKWVPKPESQGKTTFENFHHWNMSR